MLIKELMALKESETKVKVGDACKADPIDEGDYIYGKITKIEDDLAYSDLDDGERTEFCGDIPTRKEDGVWVFDGF